MTRGYTRLASALFALLLMCTSLIPAHAEEAQRVEVDGVVYSLDSSPYNLDGDIYIIESIPKDTDVVTIQTMIDGKRVWYDQNYADTISATTLVFAEGGTDVPYMRLEMWPNLQRICLPASVTDAGTSMLWSVSGTLAAYEVAPGNTAYCAIDGLLYTRDGKTLLCFPPAKGGAYTLPENTEAIDSGAFQYGQSGLGPAPALTHLTLPRGLNNDDIAALPTYETLQSITIPQDDAHFEVRDSMIFERGTDTLLYIPTRLGGACQVPSGTKHVSGQVFRAGGGAWLRSVSLPLSLAVLESDAFAFCTALENVALPLTLRAIPDGAFRECISLERLVVPPYVETIGMLAFNGCERLREVYIPDSVTFIDPTAFDYTHEGLVIYASEGSTGHLYAKAHAMYWAPPGDTPARLPRERLPAAVVNRYESGAEVDLRASASSEAKSLARYPNGTLVEVLGQEGEWSSVRVGPQRGYIRTEDLMPMDPLTRLIPLNVAVLLTDKQLRTNDPYEDDAWPYVYSYPGWDAPRIMSYDNPDVSIIEAVGPWVFVDCPQENTGYYPLQFCEVFRRDEGHDKRYGIVVNPNPTDRLHLRTSASKASESMGRYYTGTQVEIIGETADWYQVLLEGKTGYMMKDFVREVMVGRHWWEDLD